MSIGMSFIVRRKRLRTNGMGILKKMYLSVCVVLIKTGRNKV